MRVQAQGFIECASHFEGAGLLKQLELQIHIGLETLAERMAAHQRRARHERRYALAGAFALRNCIVRIAGIALKFLGVARVHLFFRQSVENPKVAFSQSRVDQHALAAARAYDLRCRKSASQIAAVERRELFIGQPRCQRLRLRNPALGQRAVQMPLMATFQIPRRLAMANDNDLCSRVQM